MTPPTLVKTVKATLEVDAIQVAAQGSVPIDFVERLLQGSDLLIRLDPDPRAIASGFLHESTVVQIRLKTL